MKTSHYAQAGWKYLVLIAYTAFALFPILWMLIISFKSNRDMFTTMFFFRPTLANYKAVLVGTPFLRSMLDSLIVSIGAVVLGLLVGVPTAYALARFEFRGRESLAFNFLSFKFAPGLLVSMPLYIIYQKIGLFDTFAGLIWVYQLIAIPFIVWILRSYFQDISFEIECASYVDGYSRLATFWRVLLPLVRPGLVAAGLLVFIFCWNAFTFPLVLTGSNIPIVTVQTLNFLSSTSVNYGQLGVAAVVSALPEVMLALLIQRHLVQGLSLGAVKG